MDMRNTGIYTSKTLLIKLISLLVGSKDFVGSNAVREILK